MLILRWCVVVFLLLASLATWVPHVRIAGVGPDLLLGVVFLVALRRGANWGSWTGFALGLLVAVEDPGLLGMESLAYAAAGFAVGRGSRSLDRRNPYVLLFLLFASSLLAESLRVGWLSISGAGSAPVLWLRFALPGACYTTVWLPLLAYLASRVLGRRDWLFGAS